MSENGPNQELEVKGPGGVGVRAKGYRLMDLVWFIVAGAVIAALWLLLDHDKSTAASLKETRQQLKDDGKELSRAIQDMTKAQVRMVEAQRELTCVIAYSRERPDASAERKMEFCRRVARDDR